MRIGEVARRAGVTVKTVRHYESLGLIRAERRPNGYRDYDDETARLVSEAHALSRVGIRLEQTKPFLDCLTSGNENADDCATTRPAYRAAIGDLSERIDDLTRRRDALRALLAAADERTELTGMPHALEPGCAHALGPEAGPNTQRIDAEGAPR